MMRSSRSAWKPKEDRFVGMEPGGRKQTPSKNLYPQHWLLNLSCFYIIYDYISLYIYLTHTHRSIYWISWNSSIPFWALVMEMMHRLHSDLWICRKAGKIGADSRGPGEEPLHCRKGSQSAAVKGSMSNLDSMRSEVSWAQPVLK